MRVRLVWAAIAAAMTFVLGPAMAQQAVAPLARASAILNALRTGDPAQFEAAAQANFTPQALAHRTPEQRAGFATRVASEFGHFGPAEAEQGPDNIRATIHGPSDRTATLVFTFDAGAEHKIAALGMEAQLGGAPSGPALPTPQINGSMSPAQISAAIDAYFAPMVAHDDFAGAVLVAHNGQAVATRAYGPANREHHAANTVDTMFNIASIGKKFTQTAIARLIQDGKLHLTDTVGQLLPDYPNEITKAATINQLIEMQGGVADFFSEAFDAAPKAQFISNHAYYNFVSHQPPHFAPGSQTEYCNGCYIVLGEIVERVSGMKFEDYVQRNVFTPAGMTRTGYVNRTAPPANTAHLYTREGNANGAYGDADTRGGYTGSGAGGVYSTVGDLLKFDNALRDERLLNGAETAWVLNEVSPTRPHEGMLSFAGGTQGANALVDSDGRWSVFIAANVDPPLPMRAGTALAQALRN